MACRTLYTGGTVQGGREATYLGTREAYTPWYTGGHIHHGTHTQGGLLHAQGGLLHAQGGLLRTREVPTHPV